MLDHLDITHPMSPRNPRNRLMRFINEFHYEEDEPYEGNHVVAVRPALIGTFFFKGGYTKETKAKIVECYDYFYELFKPYIKGKKISDSKFTNMTEKQYPKLREKVLTIDDPDTELEWVLGSEANQYSAPTHSIDCFTRYEWDEREFKFNSWLRFTVPADILNENTGRATYHALVTFICEHLHPEHGYGGLSASLPYARHRYERNEYALSQRFMGLEVDAGSFILGDFLKDHIKGANWYTWFDDSFVDKLGGEQAIRDYLTGWPAITLHRYSSGLIIQAGDTPDLGDPSDTTEPYRGAPALYVVVNHLIKPIRYPNLGSRHTHHEDEPTLNDDSTTAWQRRFDDLPLPPHASVPPAFGNACHIIVAPHNKE